MWMKFMRVHQIEALISTTKEEVFGQVERDESALLKGVNEWLDGSITMRNCSSAAMMAKNLLPGNTMQ